VNAFASEYKLTVINTNNASRTVKLEGNVSQLSVAFNVTLMNFNSTKGEYYGYLGQVHVPTKLADAVIAVLGFDNRPFAKRKTKIVAKHKGQILGKRKAQKGFAGYTPAQVARFYNFSTTVNGTGICVAILELGGGYYTKDLMYPSKVISVGVDGVTNAPNGDPDGDDGEVALDIQVVQGAAPGATIVVYFAPNTEQGFLNVLIAAYTNTSNCKVAALRAISNSWGSTEPSSNSSNSGYDSALKSAGAKGVVVSVSSGDSGSSEIEYPCVSPYALCVGGTSITVSGTTITSEVAWAYSGGGVSTIYPKPSWQSSLSVAYRGVPDVSANADPKSGYAVKYNGKSYVFGGTSASAPLWAALVALVSQKLGKPLGPINSALYAIGPLSHSNFDITSGNNGAYSAKVGWDEVTGLGRPSGANLATVFANASSFTH